MDAKMDQTPADRTADRNKAIDTAMRALFGPQGPDADIDADAIRGILGTVFDAGATLRSAS